MKRPVFGPFFVKQHNHVFYDLHMSVSTNNIIAITLIGIAKVCGLFGVLLGYTNFRELAALLLFLCGLFLIVSISLCVYNLKNTSKIENSDKEVLRRLQSEGTLKQYLSDICQNAN